MKYYSRIVFALVFVSLTAASAHAQQPDPSLKAAYGEVTLKVGFKPDPVSVQLTAGGSIRTNLGGFQHYVAQAPDYSVNYTAGASGLTFAFKAVGDTTLLVRTPDGKWIGDDDSGEGLDPYIRILKPSSGQYDIWVGTVGKNPLRGTLFITERKTILDGSPKPPPPAGGLPDCFIISAGIDNYRNANDLNGCLNDARNTVAAFNKQQGYLFRNVKNQTLLDSTATTAEITKRFDGFTKTGAAGDYMVLFLSGHGTRTNKDMNWAFLPFDYNPKNFGPTTLSDKEILNIADKLATQKKNVVIIIDACFSGQLALTAQPFLRKYATAKNGGIVIMTSSSATQTSSALGNYSAFAKAFFDGMTTKDGDLNKNGKVTLGEIQSYSSTRTAQLLTQARITNKQDLVIVWSPSISRDTVFAVPFTGQGADPIKPPPVGVSAKRWAGTETLAGFGKLSFVVYGNGRVTMTDAKDSEDGSWRISGNVMTMSFYNATVIYTGTISGNKMSGIATAPKDRMAGRQSWNWTVTAQN